jgi:hypothetical protein
MEESGRLHPDFMEGRIIRDYTGTTRGLYAGDGG